MNGSNDRRDLARLVALTQLYRDAERAHDAARTFESYLEVRCLREKLDLLLAFEAPIPFVCAPLNGAK